MRSSALEALLKVAASLLLIPLLTAGLLAQTSGLSGVVTDPTGGVVPGVEITLTNPATTGSRTVITDEVGRYSFDQVAPGAYELRASLAGFNTTVVTGLVLQVDVKTTQDLVLQVGEISEMVMVTSDVQAGLNTVDATLGNSFNERQILELPLDTRNVASLLTLQPGVSALGEVSGARRDQSNLTLDGIDVNDNQSPGIQPGIDANCVDEPWNCPNHPGSPRQLNPVLRITPDSVQEFRVTVSNPSASQGRSAGGQVTLITKSGTNEWHGSAYAYHRNTVTTANDFFNNRLYDPSNENCSGTEENPGGDCAVPRPKLLRNLFGGSVGGPILKDKAFFFFNYEARSDRSEETVLRNVPLPHMGVGSVRYVSSNAGEIVELDSEDIARLYPGLGGVNPVAVAVLGDAVSRYQPNDLGAGDQLNTSGFRFNYPTPLNQNAYIAKMDFNLSAQHNIWVRGNYQWDTQNRPGQFLDTHSPTVWSHPVGFTVGHGWSVTPTFTNTFRYGLTRQAYTSEGDSEQAAIRFPVYSPRKYTRTSARVAPTHNFVNDLSWIRGKHTFQLGTNIRLVRNRRDSFKAAYDNAGTVGWAYERGSLEEPIDDLDENWEGSYLGAVASVLGRLTQYGADYTFLGDGTLGPHGTPSAREFASESYDFYIEDNWQLTPDLTMNLGLRYGINTPVNETTGFQVQPVLGLGDFFDQRVAGAAAGTPVNNPIYIDKAGPFYGKKGYYPMDWSNFMPRVSFAWSPHFESGFLKKIFGGNGRSVLRGGFAMMYDHVGTQLAVAFDEANQLGFNSSETVRGQIYNTTDKPPPLFTGFNQDIRSLPNLHIPGPLEFPRAELPDGARRIEGSLDDNLVTPVNFSWNFSLGREFNGGLFVEASYVGRSARDLLATRDILHPNNLVDPASGMSWYEAAGILYDARKAGTALEQFPALPFFDNLFPDSTSKAGDTWWGDFLQRDFGIDPQSLTPTQLAYAFVSPDYLGEYTSSDWTYLQEQWDTFGSVPNAFYHPSYGAFMTRSSMAESDYHGLTLTARQRFGSGLTWDFNYTWSKSMDTASGLQDSRLIGGGAIILNPLYPDLQRARSDFDTNHIINTNWLWELPYGRGRQFGSGANSFVDALLGGWALNGIFRWNSGAPLWSPGDYWRWSTNWQITSAAIRIRDPKVDPHKGGEYPNFWADPQYAYNSFTDVKAGGIGDRNVFNRPNYVVLDFGLHKAFTMPYNDQHRLVFRWEVFNATNTQVLGHPRGWEYNCVEVDAESKEMLPGFGKIREIQGRPRVMQFGLRLEF